MTEKNTVLNGKYKGYKFELDIANKKVNLLNGNETINLNKKIKSLTIVKSKRNIFYIELIENDEKLECYLDFLIFTSLAMFSFEMNKK